MDGLIPSTGNEGLFHKAILQHRAGHTYSSIEKANAVANEFLHSTELLGYSASDLPAMTSDQLILIQAHFLGRPDIYKEFGILPFSPVVEPSLLSLPPHTAITNGCAKEIPLIAGNNTDKWTLFVRQNINSKDSI